MINKTISLIIKKEIFFSLYDNLKKSRIASKIITKIFGEAITKMNGEDKDIFKYLSERDITTRLDDLDLEVNLYVQKFMEWYVVRLRVLL